MRPGAGLELLRGLVVGVTRWNRQNAGGFRARIEMGMCSRSLSFHCRGRAKLEIIRNNIDEELVRQEGSEDEDDGLRFDPGRVVASDNEDDKDPDSLARRLEDAQDEPVLSVLNKWIQDGKESRQGMVSAMKRLKYLGRFKDALELSNFVIQERRSDQDKFHYLNHLELLGRVQSMSSAERYLRKMPRLYSKTEDAQMVMFDNYIAHEDVHGASLVLRGLREGGFLRTPTAFNKLIGLCAKKRRVEKIPYLLRDMKQACLSPDVETYNVLITAKAKNGDVQGMEALLGKLKQDEDGGPDAAIYCSLASGYVNAGKFSEAAKYLDQVVADAKFRQSRKYHDIVIAIYAAMGRVDEVDRLWKFSKKFPVIPVASYIAAIAAYEKVGQVDKAEEVFAELELRKKSVKARHFNALLQAYSQNNQMRKAEKLFDRMVRTGCKPDMGTYHHLVAGYMRSGNQQAAVETLDKMLNERLSPASVTMMLVLEYHAENGDVDQAEKLFEQMRREGYNHVQAYNVLLKAYVRAEKHAFRFLQRLASDKVKPNQATFDLLDKLTPLLSTSVDPA